MTEEIIAAILASPAIRELVEGIATRIIVDLIHMRATDPAFLSASDAVFSQIRNAKSPQDLLSAQKNLSNLMSRD